MSLPQPPDSPRPAIGLLTPTTAWMDAAGDGSLGLFEIDLQTREARWSTALFEMFGLDSHSGASIDEALARIHPDDAAARSSAFELACNEGADAPYAANYRVALPDGSVRWLSSRGRTLREAGAARLVGIVTDETAHRRATAELAEMAQRRDRFLALLAHDLRNPLAPLHTAAELMRRAEMQPARVIAISDMLARQVTQMAHLIDDLVDVSRANQGRIELRREPIDLRALVEQSVDAVRGFVERRRQAIETRFGDPAPSVEADAERLTQVVTHLLEHASRSSTEDSVIRVSATRQAEAVELTVSDDGAGIEASRLGQVFDLYPPADGDPGRRQTLGTGMALVKALVTLHGGTVAAESAGIGQGATYTVRIPD